MRRTLQTTVAFLTTRVKKPNKDDWEKLKRVLRYLSGTKYLKLCISVDDLGMLKWYVDRSHNVHWDCKDHAGTMFTLGQGAVTSYLRKVKFNTKSSTKTELFGADMYMPEVLWTLYFIQSQGVRRGDYSALSRQQKYTTTDEEWAILKQKEDKTY